jgi:drug/metabolite transporter (DMT)-like permease
MKNNSSQTKATFVGFCAILLWGMLALLTSFTGNVPAFELTAMTFFIAFLASAVAFVRAGADFSILRQPPAVWLNGVLGLFGYHALYFMALKSAPAVEASLINYLWPVLIVLFSSFLPGEKLRLNHALGVALGFAGVIVLLLAGGPVTLDPRYLGGYLLALACSVIWAVYSVNSRRFQAAPTMLIGAFCGITALLSLVCHLLFEKTVMPSPSAWLPILLLGLGPVGLAFFAWDYGVKRGNIKVLGALSYIAPLLSSALLIVFGQAQFHVRILLACLCIVAGSVVASRGSVRKGAASAGEAKISTQTDDRT